MNKHIHVIDSIMGSGKSTYLINKLKTEYAQLTFANTYNDGWTQVSDPLTGALKQVQLPVPKYLVVVPLLSEVKRFIDALPELEFEDPQPIEGKKLLHLKTLVKDGRNIVTTHALFSLLNREIYKELQEQGYVLIIDECLDAVSLYKDLYKYDMDIVFDSEMVIVDPVTKRLAWNYNKYPTYFGKFDNVKDLCDIGSLVLYSDDSNNKNRSIILWQFPSEFISCFTEVWIATYLFYGSPFSAYLEAEGFTVTLFYTRGGRNPELIPFNKADCLTVSSQGDREIRAAIAKHINIYEGSMNDIGANLNKFRNPYLDTTLSSGWFKRADTDQFARLQKNIYNFCNNIAPTKRIKKQDPTLNSRGQLKFPDKMISVPSCGWTSFSDHKTKLSGKGYAKGWIANNMKATNDYAHMTTMVYALNWYPNPIIEKYFLSVGVQMNKEAYALSGLIQWLWRSKIRTMEAPIAVYIPSRRMRTLFKDWLNGLDIVQQGQDIRAEAA